MRIPTEDSTVAAEKSQSIPTSNNQAIAGTDPPADHPAPATRIARSLFLRWIADMEEAAAKADVATDADEFSGLYFMCTAFLNAKSMLNIARSQMVHEHTSQRWRLGEIKPAAYRRPGALRSAVAELKRQIETDPPPPLRVDSEDGPRPRRRGVPQLRLIDSADS